jgi:hypothetical protein
LQKILEEIVQVLVMAKVLFSKIKESKMGTFNGAGQWIKKQSMYSVFSFLSDSLMDFSANSG